MFNAIVTGGSKGIGAEIVKTLSLNNFNVILNYNTSEKEAKEIGSQYKNIKLFKADLSKANEANNLINFAIKELGSIDLLVNNAGIDFISTIDNTSNKDFDLILKTNLYSAFYCSRDISKFMISQKKGCIINISSIWGICGASCEVAYSISKSGLDGLTKSLAKELAPSNIRVNSIAPGIINTDMNKNLNKTELQNIINDIPLQKIGSPKDIANMVINIFNSPYITGQIIQINGGWNI